MLEVLFEILSSATSVTSVSIAKGSKEQELIFWLLGRLQEANQKLLFLSPLNYSIEFFSPVNCEKQMMQYFKSISSLFIAVSIAQDALPLDSDRRLWLCYNAALSQKEIIEDYFVKWKEINDGELHYLSADNMFSLIKQNLKVACYTYNQLLNEIKQEVSEQRELRSRLNNVHVTFTF